jgi:hypothetical protein
MIRKIFLTLIAFLSSAYLLTAQVFNTAETLAPLKFSAGIAPIYYNENFGNDLYIPLWLPLGIEIRLGNMVAFLFEVELPVSRPAGAIIDGGFLFRF